MAKFSRESAEKLSWYCGLLLGVMLLMSYHCETSTGKGDAAVSITRKPCDEMYVVKEGETLHTISDKCGDPFILEDNLHIREDDDVYPGLVIKITPFKSS